MCPVQSKPWVQRSLSINGCWVILSKIQIFVYLLNKMAQTQSRSTGTLWTSGMSLTPVCQPLFSSSWPVMDTILFFLHPSIYTSAINHTDSSNMYNLSKQLSKQVINTYLYYVCMYMHVLTNTGQNMWDRALAIYSV